MPKARLISVERRITPTRTVSGDDATVILTVKNCSAHTVDCMRLDDQLPNDLTLGGGTNHLVLSLRKDETLQFQYRIAKPRRGSYQIGPTHIRTYDNQGLRMNDFEISNRDDLIVIPDVEKLQVVDLRGERFGPWPGLVPSKRLGIGTEFFEISPYTAGDDLRRINWRASARLGMLVTNEYEGEQVTDVLVVLDCSYDASGLFDYDAFEFQVSFAASLCSQLFTQGNRVGLSIYGATRTWVSPGFGKRHLLRLLDSLAFASPGRATLPIKYVTESVVSAILPSRSLVVLISPMTNDEVVDMLEAIATNGYTTLCLTPSVRKDMSEIGGSAAIAQRIFAAERNLRIIRAGKIAGVVQLSAGTTLKPSHKVRRSKWNNG